MTLVTPGDEKKEIISEKVCGYLYVKREFQCVDKFVVVIIDGEPYTLKAGDRLVFSARQNDEVAIFCMGDGAMSLLCTYYNEDEAKLNTAETEIEEMLKASAPETANEPQAAAAAASENVIFYNGEAHKLDDVIFHIPEDDYCKPWKFTSSDARFEMEFVPIIDRCANLDYKLIVSDQHQVFGKMSGVACLDDGTQLKIRDVLCFAEKVHNRY